MKQVLRLLNLARVWVNRVLWAKSATHAYNKPPEPGSPVGRFRDNEEIPLRGQRWRVVKRVGGNEPVLLLQPVGPTTAFAKLAGAVGKRRRRILEDEATKRRAAIQDNQLADRIQGAAGSKAS